MAILDRQGRLFGKVSILDAGAVLVVLLVLIGLFVVPGNSGTSIAQIGAAKNKPVEVAVMIRGLTVLNPDNLLKAGEKTNIIIRNQPHGQVEVKKVEVLIPKIPVPKLDGTVSIVNDPRLSEIFVRDFAITLGANAQITDDGVVFGGDKVKVGTSVDLEGPKYLIRGSVMDVSY